jgi:hypothetical protein
MLDLNGADSDNDSDTEESLDVPIHLINSIAPDLIACQLARKKAEADADALSDFEFDEDADDDFELNKDSSEKYLQEVCFSGELFS